MRKSNRLVAALFAVNAVLLFSLVAVMGGRAVTPVASASLPAQPEPETTTPPFNAAEQRKQMITQLDQISARLVTIEKKLNSGISVKVTEMPEVIVRDNSKKK